jgi:hypothetical protein
LAALYSSEQEGTPQMQGKKKAKTPKDEEEQQTGNVESDVLPASRSIGVQGRSRPKDVKVEAKSREAMDTAAVPTADRQNDSGGLEDQHDKSASERESNLDLDAEGGYPGAMDEAADRHATNQDDPNVSVTRDLQSIPESESNVGSSVRGRGLATADAAAALQRDSQDDVSDADSLSEGEAGSAQAAALEDMINSGNWLGAVATARGLSDNKDSNTSRGLVDEEVNGSHKKTSSNSATSGSEGVTVAHSRPSKGKQGTGEAKANKKLFSKRFWI